MLRKLIVRMCVARVKVTGATGILLAGIGLTGLAATVLVSRDAPTVTTVTVCLAIAACSLSRAIYHVLKGREC
jgi:hypothetical protein